MLNQGVVMKYKMKSKKQKTLQACLAGRLTAYSVMAGAALAFMPAADGAIVSPDNFYAANAPSHICGGLIQSQQIQSQKIRHRRHAGKHVLNSSTYASCGSSSGSGSHSGE